MRKPWPVLDDNLQELQHFIQIARHRGIEVIGDDYLLKQQVGLYGFERDSRTDICDFLGLDWEKWIDENSDSR